jgi:MscS family membrane protein
MPRFEFTQRLLFGCVLLFALLAVKAVAQEVDTPPPVETVDLRGLDSPRATMETFLGAMAEVEQGRGERFDRAIGTLDLSDVPPLIRSEKGRDLSWMLLEALERTRSVNLKKIPARKSGRPYVFRTYPAGRIAIARQPDGRWLFSAGTLTALPDILDHLAQKKNGAGEDRDDATRLPWHLRLRQRIPDQLRKEGFLLEHWQWLGILLTIAAGIVADKLTSVLLLFSVRYWRRRHKPLESRILPDDWLRPLGLLSMAAIWWTGLNMLALPAQAMLVLLVAVKILVALSAIWAGFRVVDFVSAYLQRLARQTDNKLDDALVPLVRKTLKVFVTVIGIIFIASNLNLNVSGLLAGLGLGGLAFALAAKDMVQNLFGSITVLLDQTFHVGDWVVIDDIEGTVEEVGLRSTRIRTFYNSEIILPNSRLITASVDNMGKRRFRRMSCKLSLTYDTAPEKIEAFCEGVRELVRLHPFMRKDYYHIYLNEMAAASLDILVYVFWRTPDWGTELRERHRFLLDILRLAKRLGVEFAFPTQTVYLKQGDAAETGDTGTFDAETTLLSQPEDARDVARAIVEETTGLNAKLRPVSFK